MNATYAMDEHRKFSIITNPRVVLNTLQQLVNERASITCKAAGTPDQESFSSRVVKVEANSDILVIQKPGVNGWQYNLQPDSHVDVVSHLSSGTIKFNTAIFGLDDIDDPLFCELSLPQQLERKQLRTYYRVPLLRYESRLVLQLAQDLVIEGNCIDISMGGVTGWFPGLEGKFSAGDPVPDCHILIEQILDLCCPATISRVEKTRNGNPILGLCFQTLESRQSRRLQQAISQLERRNLLR